MQIVPSRLGGTCSLKVPPTPGQLRVAEWTAAGLGTVVFPIAAIITWFLFASLVAWLPDPNRMATAADSAAMLLLPLLVALVVSFNVPALLARVRPQKTVPVVTLRWHGSELTLEGCVDAALDLHTLRWSFDDGLTLSDAHFRHDFPTVVLDYEDRARLDKAFSAARRIAHERFDDTHVPEPLQRLGAQAEGVRNRNAAYRSSSDSSATRSASGCVVGPKDST